MTIEVRSQYLEDLDLKFQAISSFLSGSDNLRLTYSSEWQEIWERVLFNLIDSLHSLLALLVAASATRLLEDVDSCLPFVSFSIDCLEALILE